MAAREKDLTLKVVCDVLGNVDTKWFQIGVQLGIPRHVLKRFKKDEDDPLSAAIDYWLKGNVEGAQVSWKSIVTALKARTVEEPALANTLSDQYCKKDTEDKSSIGPNPSTKELRKQKLGVLFGVGCFDLNLEKPKNAKTDKMAVVPLTSRMWEPNSTLKVSFKTSVPPIQYKGDSITRPKIVEWMNEWSKSEYVPKFIFEEAFHAGDIRIDFVKTATDPSWSDLGKDESKKKDECTMMLNLHGQYDDYKKWVVLHETGHALGFIHEHQHPTLDHDTFDMEKVIPDLMSEMNYNHQQATDFYKQNYEKPADTTDVLLDDDGQLFQFDKDSVMRYRIRKSWVREPYIEYFSSEYEDDYLWPLAMVKGELSENDKKFANSAYKKHSKSFPQRKQVAKARQAHGLPSSSESKAPQLRPVEPDSDDKTNKEEATESLKFDAKLRSEQVPTKEWTGYGKLLWIGLPVLMAVLAVIVLSIILSSNSSGTIFVREESTTQLQCNDPVEIQHLQSLDYDSKGKTENIMIIKKIGGSWKDLANLFGFDVDVIKENEGKAENCCRQVLKKWLEKNGASGFSATWKGLIKALKKIELVSLAENIETALAC